MKTYDEHSDLKELNPGDLFFVKKPLLLAEVLDPKLEVLYGDQWYVCNTIATVITKISFISRYSHPHLRLYVYVMSHNGCMGWGFL